MPRDNYDERSLITIDALQASPIPIDATLKERVAVVKSERDIAQVSFDRAVAEMKPETRISEEKIATFVEVMRENVMSGDTPFRRAYIRSIIDQAEVDDAEIRVHGRQTVLERLVMGGGASPAGVPSFVRKWRPGRTPYYARKSMIRRKIGNADMVFP